MPLTISAGYSSACSSSVATGMISLSTKVWTAARISCWTSLRPSVRASRAMVRLPSLRGWRFELGGARQPGGASFARDHQGHLAGGLVDHLVAEHRRAFLPAGL